MRWFFFHLFIIFSFLLEKGHLYAEKVQVQTFVSKKEITIGEKFIYKLTLTYPTTLQVNKPSVQPDFGEFEIKGVQFLPPITQNHTKTETITYFLAIYELGTFTIPSITLPYETAGRQTAITTQTHSIKVVPSTSITNNTLTDIKPLTSVEGILSWKRIVIFVMMLSLNVIRDFLRYFSP